MSNKEVARKMIGQTDIVLKLGDLTREKADVIVNAANRSLSPGGGVCGAICRAAGMEIFEECRKILANEGIDQIQTGEARISSSGNLFQIGIKAVIHAAGPVGSGDEELRAAYRNSLELAHSKGHKTIAFPSISTGIFGYPLDEAAPSALSEIEQFIKKHPQALQEVRFVFLDDQKTLPYYLRGIK